MLGVTCTIDNKDNESPEKIVVSSVSSGVGRVEVSVGTSHAEVDGKELIAAVQNCLNTL